MKIFALLFLCTKMKIIYIFEKIQENDQTVRQNWPLKNDYYLQQSSIFNRSKLASLSSSGENKRSHEHNIKNFQLTYFLKAIQMSTTSFFVQQLAAPRSNFQLFENFLKL